MWLMAFKQVFIEINYTFGAWLRFMPFKLHSEVLQGDIIKSMRGIAATGATPFLSPMLEDDPAAAAATNNDSDRSSIHERNLRVIFDCINICSDPKLAALQPRVLAIKLTAFISCLHLVQKGI